MTIKDNAVVGMNYTLKDKDGNVIDASQGEPFHFIQGLHQIIPGLEKQLYDKTVGDKLNVHVQPADGYGEYRPDLKFAVDLDQFGQEKPEVGMLIQLTANNGQPFLAKIESIAEKEVVLDANHPLAGFELFFDVEIASIREATAEELEHGHVHGPGGHHH